LILQALIEILALRPVLMSSVILNNHQYRQL